MNGLNLMMYDRFIGLTAGERIRVYLISNQRYEGVFYSIDPFDLKFLVISNPKAKIDDEIKYVESEYLKIDMNDLVAFEILHKNVKQSAKGGKLFNIKIDILTDVDISKRTSTGSGNIKKNLVEYKVEKESALYLCNLEEDSCKNWDQFALNKSKFNVPTSYDENHYTTRLDYNAIPIQIKIKADQIAKELMECDKVLSTHLKEERGLISQSECDEEIKYSTVIREGFK